MNAALAVLRDRRRSQKGSVLSGVLIITAFLAIISAALLTELSTNLLLSRTLVHQVSTEATVDSAVETAIDKLQSTAINSGCPAPPATALNQLSAVATYARCETTSTAGPQHVAGSSAFTVDGTHVVLGSGWNVDEYLVADSSNLYELNFGTGSLNWSYSVGGALTGPPLAMKDAITGAPNVLDLLPTAAGCGGAPGCVQVLLESAGSQPSNVTCAMAAGGTVTSRPAAGIRNPTVAFFGDSAGDLYAYSPGTSNDADCTENSNLVVPNHLPVVAGPFVFAGPSGTDEVFVITSDGTTNQIDQYVYQSGSFASPSSHTLPFSNATVVGVTADGTSLPARLAVAYSDGHVSMVQISSSFAASNGTSAQLPSSLSDAPAWCACPAGTQIGFGGLDGNLYVTDPSFNVQATFDTGSTIRTSPSADAAGDWFVAADDGYLYAATQPAGQSTLVQEYRSHLDGSAGTSTISGPCANDVCVYVGTSYRDAWLTSFDARNVTMTACVISGSSCSGANPRLWTSLQVQAATGQLTVQISGWSYYSP